MPFLPSPVKERGGEAFTCKLLMHSFLRPYGEEVKANNEKTPDARVTRARWALKWGQKELRWEPAVESMIERLYRTQMKKVFR